jgi:hypothetical protein
MIGRATGDGIVALSLEFGPVEYMMAAKVTTEIRRIVRVEELKCSSIDASISMVRD